MTADPSLKRRGRPLKVLAGDGNAREALIRTGVAALTAKGFTATGLDESLRTAGVPKGSFYHYFDSKDAFGAELIRRYAEYFASRLERFFADRTLSPLAQLDAFTRDAEASMQRHGFSRGCLVGNLGQEMGALPESYRTLINGVFADWQRRTSACLRRAQGIGEIATHHDADRLAAFFWIGWEGAVLRAKLERSGEALRTFADGFFAMIRIEGRDRA